MQRFLPVKGNGAVENKKKVLEVMLANQMFHGGSQTIKAGESGERTYLGNQVFIIEHGPAFSFFDLAAGNYFSHKAWVMIWEPGCFLVSET